MSQLASWFHQRSPFRMAHNRQPPLVNMDAGQPPNHDPANPTNPTAPTVQRKTQDPLFGPNIGAVSMGPPWTITSDKKFVTDDLTPEIVSGWVEKSKEPAQPTTTLQALVNLKRPTLRLSPLAAVSDDPSSLEPHHLHHHGLEFEYDCDAPKCGIYVYVYLPKDHPDAPATHHPMAKLLVFETVVEGGFGKTLRLEEGALLELGRFETVSRKKLSNADDLRAGSSSPPGSDPAVNGESVNWDGTSPIPGRNPRRRFTHFHFRRRSHNQSVSGPALAVVDAEPAAAADGNKKEGKEDVENEGVRVTIRLAALDEQGTELASPNEQVTYLHIVRFGAKQASAVEGEADEDNRPWVVKVVKREATIGPHTFHLHEIYGLTSSSSSQSHQPTSTLPTVSEAHTYPPESAAVQPAAVADDDDPQSECLLCLSAPREVILLPCRHLVACKDCALNMVEFGAGGTITQTAEPPAGDAAENGEAGANGEGAAAAAPATPITPTTNPRRKRKAKGWFCPVCRQPYTSLLRITTTAPESSNKEEVSSGAEEDSPTSPSAASNPVAPGTSETNGGLLGGIMRPGFLRGLSLRSPQVPPPIDVESRAGLGRTGE